MLENSRIWLFYLIENKDFWLGVMLWLILAAPLEMLAHELGHILIALKYGVRIRFLKIGIGKFWRWKLKNGIRVLLGIPIGLVATRMVGDGAEKYKQIETNNPASFTYGSRHPKERFFIVVAGPLCAMGIFTVLFGVCLVCALVIGVTLPLSLKTVFGFVLINELINLLIPIRFNANTATDGWWAIQYLWQWLWWKQL